jgi:hypothetical protein
LTSPAIVESSVVLPLPLDPTSATAVPRVRRNEVGASATVDPKWTQTSDASTSASVVTVVATGIAMRVILTLA